MPTGADSNNTHEPVARLMYANSDETTKQIAAFDVFIKDDRYAVSSPPSSRYLAKIKGRAESSGLR